MADRSIPTVPRVLGGRSADGTLGEIVAPGRYDKKEPSKLSRIARVTLQVNDLQKARAFYKNVFEFGEALLRPREPWN